MLGKIAKAIIGGIAAGAGAYQTAALDGSVTANEWASLIGAAIVAGFLVWGYPNTTPAASDAE